MDVAALKLLATFAATYLYFIASAGPKEAYWLAHVAATEAKSALAAGAQKLLTRISTSTSARALSEAIEHARERLAYVRDWRVHAVRSVETLLTKDEKQHVSGSIERLVEGLTTTATEETKRLEREAKGWSAHLRGKLTKVSRRKSAQERRAEKLVPVRSGLGPPTLDPVPASKRRKFSGARWDSILHRAFWWSDGKRSLAEVIRLVAQETGAERWDLVEVFEALAKHKIIKLHKRP